jgi:hypothetical protein
MLRRGDFALCNFPFRGVDGPGPSPHIVLCAATGGPDKRPFAVVFYTTSQIGYAGSRRPRQYLLVDDARARTLNQPRAFHVDASRIARLPLEPAYFPTLVRTEIAVIARDRALVDRAEQRLRELLDAGFPVSRVDLVKRA